MPEPVPERDYDECPISHQPIEDILTAIDDPETGKPARFEAVLERLANREQLEEGERIIYIGAGVFAVAEDDPKKRCPVIKRRIEFEDTHQREKWRKELSPGISKDYPPHPEPIHELYKDEDIREWEYQAPTILANNHSGDGRLI
ncbi:MAG: hypothetical protein D6B26_05525 [Spirochaetaceae bacterium]|nr:MAG: hypothetical protein D6B26_05525 [Spirochaetaceae bacterium]